MRKFEYKIKDELGIHARPAGALSKIAKSYESKITISKGEKEVDAKRLISLMGMGIKCGDIITITVDGNDEEATEDALLGFLSSNL